MEAKTLWREARSLGVAVGSTMGLLSMVELREPGGEEEPGKGPATAEAQVSALLGLSLSKGSRKGHEDRTAWEPR